MTLRCFVLERLEIMRAPGIERSFSIDSLSPGLNLIVGPNESGKTTLCRAVHSAFWPETDRPAGAWEFEAKFVAGGEHWDVLCDRDRTTWRLDGREQSGPVLPTAALARCFVLQVDDLLAGAHAGELATRIAREMAGGYDIPAVRGRFAVGMPARAEKSRLEARSLEVARLTRTQVSLQVEEAELTEREAALSHAEGAQKSILRLERALILARARTRSSQVTERIARFAPAVSSMRAGELERLEDLAARRNKLLTELDRWKAAHLRAEKQRDDCKLPRGAIEQGTLGVWLARCEDLASLEQDLGRLADERDKAQAKLEVARRSLGSQEPRMGQPLDLSALEDVDHFLRTSTQVEGRGRAAQELQDLVERALASDDWVQRLQSSAARFRQLRSVYLGACALLFSCGIVLALLVSVWGWLIVALATFLASRGLAAAPAAEGDLAAKLVSLGEFAAVQRKLLLPEENALAERRAALVRAVGVDPGLGMVLLVQQVAASADAERDHAAAASSHERRASQREAVCAELARALREHGIEAQGAVSAIRAQIEELRTRDAAHRAAVALVETAHGQIEALAPDLATLEADMGALFESAAVPHDDIDALRARVAERVEYSEELSKLKGDRATIEQLLEELRATPDLCGLSVEELETRLVQARHLADGLSKLHASVAETKNAVARARNGNELESALARRDEAQRDLTRARAQALHKSSASFLLGEVEQELQHSGHVAQLAQARAWFGAFSAHRHELRIDGTTRSFRAFDRLQDRELELDQLSAGTRMQLLIAARLAFAAQESIRAGVRLPLFLDEALATSDPTRFEAVADALLVLVSEGWQVFYLTSQPEDTARWRRRAARYSVASVAFVDLAERRKLAVAVTGAEELALPPQRGIPSARWRLPEEYGIEIGVDSFDPRRPPGDTHVFHILRDDLELLETLLRLEIERAGPLEAFVSSPQARTLLSEAARRGLRVRIDLLRAFVGAWRVGRGKPIDREHLERAGVSTTFLDRLLAFSGEVGWNAARLIAGLKNKQVGGYQKAKTEELEEWLVQHGHIDRREVLDHGGVLREVLDQLASSSQPGFSREQATLLVDQFWHAAEKALGTTAVLQIT